MASCENMELTAYPLRLVEHQHRQRLARILWDWKLCGKCEAKQGCSITSCPWSRIDVLQKFWDRYDNITAAYLPDLTAPKPCLGSHDELLDLVEKMQTTRNVPRAVLTRTFFDENCASLSERTSAVDESAAFGIAACILLPMDGATCQDFSGLPTDDGLVLPSWRDSLSVQGFIDEAFPKKIHHYFDDQQDQSRVQHVLASLAAPNLVNHAHLRLEATSDIRQHLVINRRKGILWVYDCTPVLKEILSATLVDPAACILPRALVLEVMHTLYKILFPPGQQSEKLLSVLVRKSGFDPDMLHYELARYLRGDDPVIDLSFFSARLAEIYDELEAPTPRTRLENWFERKSDGRHMLMATMIGVFIAVIIGILGLGISGFQAYVSYQQWKHPVKDA